jgi:hypothetical protein
LNRDKREHTNRRSGAPASLPIARSIPCVFPMACSSLVDAGRTLSVKKRSILFKRADDGPYCQPPRTFLCAMGSALAIAAGNARVAAGSDLRTPRRPTLLAKDGRSPRRETAYAGVNSSKLSGMLIEMMRTSRRPARLIIASNSWAVRSRPPAVHNIIVRSSMAWLWVIGPG